MPTYLIISQGPTGLDFRPVTATDLPTLETALQTALGAGLGINNGLREQFNIGVIALDATASVTPNANPANATFTWTDSGARLITVGKGTDEARINTAALATDSALQFAMAANTRYSLRGVVFYDTTAAGDFKYGFVAPAGATVRMSRIHAIAGSAPTILALDVAVPTNVALAGTGTTGGLVRFDALVQTGGSSGTFGFQFAQNTATNDTGAIVRAGSYIEYAKVG